VQVLNEERIPRVDVFFLPNPKDRLRLGFSTLIQPCYPSANIFMLLLATVENGSYTYIWKGLRLIGCVLEMPINIREPGRPKLTPTNTY